MEAAYRNSIFNVLIITAIFHLSILSVIIFFAPYTGDVVLEGQLIPGETFEREFIINDLKDVTVGFESTIGGGSSQSEWLRIIIIDSEGNVAFNTFKNLGTTSKSSRTTVTDYTIIFEPKTIGRFYIKVTDAKFPTKIWINSGMVNITKRPFILIGAVLSNFIIILAIVIPIKYKIQNISKKQVLIAFLIGSISAYIIIYYSSM